MAHNKIYVRAAGHRAHRPFNSIQSFVLGIFHCKYRLTRPQAVNCADIVAGRCRYIDTVQKAWKWSPERHHRIIVQVQQFYLKRPFRWQTISAATITFFGRPEYLKNVIFIYKFPNKLNCTETAAYLHPIIVQHLIDIITTASADRFQHIGFLLYKQMCVWFQDF